MRVEQVLQKFGLNQKEAKVYLACLELGSTPIARIAERAGIARSSCYYVLNSLQRRGMANSYDKKKIRYFSVQEPRKLIKLAEERVKELKEILPQLDAVGGMSEMKPRLRLYQGKEGMKQVLEEVLEEGNELVGFSSSDDLFDALGDYYKEFIRRRIKKRIPVRTILRDTQKGRERQREGIKELRQVKLIPKEFDYHGAWVVVGNKIVFFSFIKDYIAVVMESRELAQIQRACFEYMWSML